VKTTVIVGLGAMLFLLALGGIYYFLIVSQGMTVTSWWRSFWKNVAVGGVENSLHMVGLAWDVIPPTGENALRLRAMGLTVIDEKDHLHAQI